MVVGAEKILQPAAKLLSASRSKNLRVIHVGLGFRAVYPEVNPGHPIFSMLRQSNKFLNGGDSDTFIRSLLSARAAQKTR